MKNIFSSGRREPHQNEESKEQAPFFSHRHEPAAAPFFTKGGGMAQAKLTVGQPGDKYEQEADAVANAVVQNQGSGAAPGIQQKGISRVQRALTSAGTGAGTAEERMREDKLIQEKHEPGVQRMEAPKEEGEEDTLNDRTIQKTEAPEAEEALEGGVDQDIEFQADEEGQPGAAPDVMTKSNGAQSATPQVSSRIEGSKGGGSPLPDATRSEMESSFGYDFSGVNVHTDHESAELNQGLSAQAFTHGQDVYFNSGKFSPGTTDGKRLLAHELTHVVQQSGDKQKGKASYIQQTHPKIQRGFLGKVWGGIKSAAKAVGGAVTSGAKAVWGGAKWLGGKISKVAKGVWSGVKWFGKQMWSKIKGIYYRAKRWITSLPSRLKRLFGHLWKGLTSLKPWSLNWWKSLGNISTWKDFMMWLGEFAIYGLEVLGIGEVYETIMDFIKFNTRPLTATEKAIAQSVFGNSLDYNLIRVDEHALLGPSWTHREYVSFHTINGWGAISAKTLIHELTHVWQYQKIGAMYMPKAIHAQSTPEEYDYGGVKELIARKSGGMFSFNMEQQGDILSDYYALKNGQSPSDGSKDDSTGLKATAADLPSYQPYVDEANK